MQTIPTMTPDEIKAYIASLPVDDEPETPEERAAVEQGLRDVANGDVYTTAELRRELGMDNGRASSVV